MSAIDLIASADAPVLARRYFVSDGETSPIVRALAQVPELVPATMPFLAQILGPSQIDLRTKELVILRVSALAQCDYCVGAHTLAAADAGVSGHERAALRGERPLAEVFGPEEVAIIELCDAVWAEGEPDARLVEGVGARLGDHVLVELVLLIGATLMLNRFCTTLRLPLVAASRERLAALEDHG